MLSVESAEYTQQNCMFFQCKFNHWLDDQCGVVDSWPFSYATIKNNCDYLHEEYFNGIPMKGTPQSTALQWYADQIFSYCSKKPFFDYQWFLVKMPIFSLLFCIPHCSKVWLSRSCALLSSISSSCFIFTCFHYLHGHSLMLLACCLLFLSNYPWQPFPPFNHLHLVFGLKLCLFFYDLEADKTASAGRRQHCHQQAAIASPTFGASGGDRK